MIHYAIAGVLAAALALPHPLPPIECGGCGNEYPEAAMSETLAFEAGGEECEGRLCPNCYYIIEICG